MELLDRVRGTIRRHHLATEHTRVVVAVSGGSDSVALIHLLHRLAEARELRLVGAAHFNHQLRADADRDQEVSARAAASLGVPFLASRGDVAALVRRERRSLEDAGRLLRHAFFEQARLAFTADAVALGHTKDDQAETFLLRVLRGAGSKGLASMHPRTGSVIRPLLDSRRADLRGHLDRLTIPYVSDASNDDVNIPRNRIRAELLPLLERRFNPSVVDILANQAEIGRGQYWHLRDQAEGWLARFSSRQGHSVVLDADALARAPVAVARTVVHMSMSGIAGRRSVAFSDVERTLGVARRAAPGFDAPGQRVERIGAGVVLTGRPSGAFGRPKIWGPPATGFCYRLSVPGSVHLPGPGGVLQAQFAGSWEREDALLGTPDVAVVQLAPGAAPGELQVRSRRPGDRFQPLGLDGRKTLQDFFVDRKVLRARRDDVPIVVDSADRIVWVAGHTIADTFRVKDAAQAVIILRLMGRGGSV